MKKKCVGLVVISMALFVGCSHQDLARPLARYADALDTREPYVRRTSEEETQRRAVQLMNALKVWERARGNAERAYSVGPDDVLQITVMSLEGPGQNTILSRTVSKEGTITLPFVGEIRVAGLTCSEIQQRVVAAYAGRYLKDPQVTVAVSEYRSAPVVVTGAVTAPGVYYLRHNESTVLEVLSLAQGLSAGAGDSLVIVRRKDRLSPEDQQSVANGVETAFSVTSTNEMEAVEAVTVDLHRLIEEGDIRMNPTIRGGDIVTVPPRKQEWIYVLGYVQRPGAFELKGSESLDALQAVALAGGLSSAARAQNSILITQGPNGRQIVPVDLTKIARGVRPPLFLEPGDTLVVGSGFFAKIGEFVRVGASATYSPSP